MEREQADEVPRGAIGGEEFSNAVIRILTTSYTGPIESRELKRAASLAGAHARQSGFLTKRLRHYVWSTRSRVLARCKESFKTFDCVLLLLLIDITHDCTTLFAAMESLVSTGAPLSQKQLASKAEVINQVLSEAEIDLWKLRELALSDGGLVDGTYLLPCCFCLFLTGYSSNVGTIVSYTLVI